MRAFPTGFHTRTHIWPPLPQAHTSFVSCCPSDLGPGGVPMWGRHMVFSHEFKRVAPLILIHDTRLSP